MAAHIGHMDTRAIHLTRSAATGTTTVTAVGAAVDTDELGSDLRALDFTTTAAGVVLEAGVEAGVEAIESLTAWGYDVVLLGGV